MGESDGWRGKEKRKEERGNRREERLWIGKDGGTLPWTVSPSHVPPEAPTPYGP